jgi:hypothetical protein
MRILTICVVALLVFVMPSSVQAGAGQAPPEVRITAPSHGMLVSGWVTVQGVASDPNGNDTLDRISVSVGGRNATTANGTTSWYTHFDGRLFPEGNLTITARAFDKKGLTASTTIIVINRHPTTTVRIHSPRDFDTVRGAVFIKGNASNPGGAQFIEAILVCFNSDGNQSFSECRFANGTTQWNLFWNTTKVPDGSYRLTARGKGPDGYSAGATITVNVQNQAPDPTLTIEYPAKDQKFNSSFTAFGSAIGHRGRALSIVARVDNQSWQSIPWIDQSRWEFRVNASRFAPGPHLLSVDASDGEGNTLAQRSFVFASQNQAPWVQILAPEPGAIVQDVLYAHGAAGDADGEVRLVQARIDGYGDNGWRNLTTTTQWKYEFDTNVLADGQYLISARAWDGQDWSAIHSVWFFVQHVRPNVPPIVNVTSPQEGASVSGRFEVVGTAFDPEGEFVRIEVLFDGVNSSQDGVWGSWAVLVDSSGILVGPAYIQVRGFDGRDWSVPVIVGVLVDNRPDLAIESIEVRETPASVGGVQVDNDFAESRTVVVTVANLGPGISSETTLAVAVEAQMGPLASREFLGTFIVPPIGIGRTLTFEIDWDVAGNVGDQDIIAVVDPDNQRIETNEANNAGTYAAFIGVGGLGGIAS